MVRLWIKQNLMILNDFRLCSILKNWCTNQIEHATTNAYYTVLATCWSDEMSPAKYQRENILILGKQSLAVTSSVLRLSFYIHHKYFLQSLNLWLTPSLVCSNTLPLSRALSLSLRYLALFPHSSDEYLTLCVQHSWSLNKCISQRVVLISKGCSYTKLSYHIILLVVVIYHCDLWCRSQWNNAL
jgi:hypothetical protein